MKNKTFICLGRPPVPPCGAVLTATERHYYETTCERCEREWGERIEAWRKGSADAEIDKMFDVPRQPFQ